MIKATLNHIPSVSVNGLFKRCVVLSLEKFGMTRNYKEQRFWISQSVICDVMTFLRSHQLIILITKFSDFVARCHPGSGSCRCKPGWATPYCDRPCTMGTFGADCSQSCNCSRHGVCDHINGQCQCQAGYHGDRYATLYLYYWSLISNNPGEGSTVIRGHIRLNLLWLLTSGTPFERPPWQEATLSVKATWQCKSKQKCIYFYPCWEATFLVKNRWPHKRGSTVPRLCHLTVWQSSQFS